MSVTSLNVRSGNSPSTHHLLIRSVSRSVHRNISREINSSFTCIGYRISVLLLLLFSILSFLLIGVDSQANIDTTNGNVVIPCANNLTCPGDLICYLASTGLTCQPPTTVGCLAMPLPNGNYYTGSIVNIGAACQRCPLPSATAQMQLLVDRYQQAVPGRLIRATLTGLGNCGPDAYCDDAQACRWKKKVLSGCDSSEQCLGFCIQNDEAGYPTCYNPQSSQAEALQRLMYFGIFFGISVGLMLLAALACALAGETRQRKEFRSCFVITILLALVLMGVAVYWEASPWPFGK